MTHEQGIAFAEKKRQMKRMKERNAAHSEAAKKLRDLTGEVVTMDGRDVEYPARRRAFKRALREALKGSK